mgnify:CR=1 FL=1
MADTQSPYGFRYIGAKRRTKEHPRFVTGILDLVEDGFGFIRRRGLMPGPDDVYVSSNQVRKSGLRPGDRVAVQVEKSPEALLLYLGCVRAGAAFLPLNTAYTPAEIEHFLGDAEPWVFVCDPATKEKLAGVALKAGVLGGMLATGAAESAGSTTSAASTVPA